MDQTLTQILTELYRAHARIAELEAIIAELQKHHQPPPVPPPPNENR